MYVVIVIGVVAFMGFYYWRYFANIKNAGGREAAGRIYWREQFGLPPDEDVVSLAIGQWYLGPWCPRRCGRWASGSWTCCRGPRTAAR
ncbi:MAG: hypothetical protein H6708_26500 [Kofleriaceae bacterium]|nr:hypothetical protein [Kofleriaceae bacterium]